MQAIKRILNRAGEWYERHYRLNVGITAGLFLLQLVHLYWLTVHVVLLRLFDVSYFNVGGTWEVLLLIVDYTEIPAIIATSILYLHELRRQFGWKNVWFLIFLNTQWLHIFWITDEFVVGEFTGEQSTVLPGWLAWVAILIDYLELPVIYDTLKKFFGSLLRPQSKLT